MFVLSTLLCPGAGPDISGQLLCLRGGASRTADETISHCIALSHEPDDTRCAEYHAMLQYMQTLLR